MFWSTDYLQTYSYLIHFDSYVKTLYVYTVWQKSWTWDNGSQEWAKLTYAQYTLAVQFVSHIFQIISTNPRNIHSSHLQKIVCSVDKFLQAIAAESLLVWGLALVVIHKKQDTILCSILKSEIYGEILFYFISLLDINWNTVLVVSGVFTQDIVLTSVSTEASHWILLPMNGDGFSLTSEFQRFTF